MFPFINLKKISDSYGVKEHLNLTRLQKHPLFYFGLGIRLTLIFLITPYIHKIWFLPFINSSISEISFDPWTTFLKNGGDNLAFPYGIVMLIFYKIISSLGYFLDIFVKSDIFFRLGFGLSSILFDLGTLFGIAFIAKKYSIKTLLLYYWCSPLVIYIIYWHGQLDILPIFLLIISIALMHIEKPIMSGISMGLAILAKSSMLIGLPFLIVYYLRNKRITKQLKLYLGPLSILLLINFIIYFKSFGFYEMVLKSPEVNKLLSLNVLYGSDLKLFFLPCIYILILYIFWSLERITLDLLLISIGIGFFSILILLPPSPGWFLWVIPFLTLYQIRSEEDYFFTTIPFYFFFLIYNFLYSSGAYINFLNIDLNQPLIYNLDFKDEIFKSLIFTGLQTSGVLVSLKMYQFGIWRNNYYAGIRGKLAIGLIGNNNNLIQDTISSIKKILVNECIENLSTYNYKKWSKSNAISKFLNDKDKENYNLINFSKDFFNIINKRNIKNNLKNSAKQNFISKRFLRKSNIIFISGFNGLLIKRIRDRTNLKILLEVFDQNLSSDNSIQKQILSINNKENYEYDLSIYLINKNKDEYKNSNKIYNQVYISMANGFFHEQLTRNLIALSSLRVDVEQSENLEKVNLIIDGTISKEDISIISKNMIINSEDLLFDGSKWSDGMMGIIELIITIHIADLLHQRTI